MIQYFPPRLRTDFAFVAHVNKPGLAAMALSYLFEPNSYLPVFSCATVEVSRSEPIVEPDIYLIQRRRMEVFNVFLKNAITSNSGFEQVVLIGLTEEQKSYLTLDRVNVWDISDENDVEAYLGGFGVGKNSTLEVADEQIMCALTQVLAAGQLLKIGVINSGFKNVPPMGASNGLAVIENYGDLRTIMGINYAASVGMEVMLVPPLKKDEEETILLLLENLDAGDQDAKDDLLFRINHRIGTISFDPYKFVTFFTKGLPYSMIVPAIPACYVNLIYAPDFFIHSGFVYEQRKGCGSAVVFSPENFDKEEVGDLCSLLDFENYYTRKLLGKDANVYNLRTAIEHYPFDLLHICTHGGDVHGTKNIVGFFDRKGIHHTVEFDTVISVSLTPFRDLHQVQSIYIFKALDGLRWKSPELEARNYDHELYASLLSKISKAYDKNEVKLKVKLDSVPNSNSISCDVFNYQAVFEQMTAPTGIPIIFNNSCWSWGTVSNSFLHSGARGYIGTLMSVNNTKATRFAKLFYEEVFEKNVLCAFHTANTDYYQTAGQVNYIYWGLHFSTLKNISPNFTNKARVIDYVSKASDRWNSKLSNGEGAPQLVKGIIEDLNWIIPQLNRSPANENTPTSHKKQVI